MDNEVIITPEQAAAELLRRRKAKDSLIEFTKYTYPKYTADPFHYMVAEKLEAVERGEIKRLMIFAPPRHGKSELSTRRFPAWFMAKNPDRNIISASYNADFAKGFGRNVRDIIETKEFARVFPDVKVRSDNRASDEWELEQGGKYFAVGVSTSTTGRGAHCLTASSLVITDHGEISISGLENLRDRVKILAYDHTEEKPVWKNCSAFAHRQADGVYRITTASGRVVEATGEHPFFANGRYVEASLLATGDRLLLAVPKGIREDGVRVHQVGEEGSEEDLLFSGVQLALSAHEQVQGVRPGHAPEGAAVLGAFLLSGVQEGQHGEEGLVVTGECQGRLSDSEALRVLQSGVHADLSRSEVLLHRVQEQGSCQSHDGRGQSRLAQRHEPAADAASFGQSLSEDQTADHRAGRVSMRGVQISGRSGGASHQHESIGQPVLQSRHAMRDLSHEVACCRAFETVEDTVALVEFVREPVTVYNITVEDCENFFANGVLTHNCFLIDDPLKDRKDADSAVTREDQWNWYRDVVYTRLEEDAPIILTLTRWHHDDIAGRLLKLMEEGRGLPWDILTLPALPIVRKTPDGQPILLDDGTVPGDALRRRPNEPLAPNRFSYAALQDRQEVLGDRSWSALYQQQPQSEEGGMFRSAWFPIIEPSELPPKRSRVRAWDLAASTDGDFTVGVLMSRDTANVYYIENVIRFRGTPNDVRDRIRKAALDDGRSVKIVIPQDPGQAGKDQAQSYIRMLSGYRVKAKRPSGPKQTRAEPLASQAEGRNVKVVRGLWNQVFFDEIDTFPLGSNDDQVDAASDAFNELQGPRKPAVFDW